MDVEFSIIDFFEDADEKEFSRSISFPEEEEEEDNDEDDDAFWARV